MEKICSEVTVNQTKNSNLHPTNKEENYEAQPLDNKTRDSGLKKIEISDDPSAVKNKINNSNSAEKQYCLNENNIDNICGNHKQNSSKITESSTLDTPCKVALFNQIFGESSGSITTSSTNSLFNNIKGLLANVTPSAITNIATISSENANVATISSDDSMGIRSCNNSKVCKLISHNRENINGIELAGNDENYETDNNNLTEVKDNEITNEVEYIEIPGLDLCYGSTTENHRPVLHINHRVEDNEVQNTVKESNMAEIDDLDFKLNSKDAGQQKKTSRSIDIDCQSMLANVLELEDMNKNVKQKSNLEMPSKQYLINNEKQKVEEESIQIATKSHLVPDNATVEYKQHIKKPERDKNKTSLEDINKNVEQISNLETLSEQNREDTGNSRAKESEDIQIKSKSHSVPDNTTKEENQHIKSHKTLLEDLNQNVVQKNSFVVSFERNSEYENPNEEGEDIQIESKCQPVFEKKNGERTYLEDVNKNVKHLSFSEEPVKHLQGNGEEKIGSEIELISCLMANTVQKQTLPQFNSVHQKQTESYKLNEQNQAIETTSNGVENIEEIENITCKELNRKQPDLLCLKSKVDTTSPVGFHTSNSGNDNLDATNNENSALAVKSSKATTTETTEDPATKSIATINDSFKTQVQEILIAETSLPNDKPLENQVFLKEKPQTATDSNGNTNNDSPKTQLQETFTSESLPPKVENSKSLNTLSKVDVTIIDSRASSGELKSGTNATEKPRDNHNDLDTVLVQEALFCESAMDDTTNNESRHVLHTEEVIKSTDKHFPLENPNASDKISKSNDAGLKFKGTDNYSGEAQIREAHMNESLPQDIENNEIRKILNAEEAQYPLENQNCSFEMAETTSAGDNTLRNAQEPKVLTSASDLCNLKSNEGMVALEPAKESDHQASEEVDDLNEKLIQNSCVLDSKTACPANQNDSNSSSSTAEINAMVLASDKEESIKSSSLNEVKISSIESSVSKNVGGIIIGNEKQAKAQCENALEIATMLTSPVVAVTGNRNLKNDNKVENIQANDSLKVKLTESETRDLTATAITTEPHMNKPIEDNSTTINEIANQVSQTNEASKDEEGMMIEVRDSLMKSNVTETDAKYTTTAAITSEPHTSNFNWNEIIKETSTDDTEGQALQAAEGLVQQTQTAITINALANTALNNVNDFLIQNTDTIETQQSYTYLENSKKVIKSAQLNLSVANLPECSREEEEQNNTISAAKSSKVQSEIQFPLQQDYILLKETMSSTKAKTDLRMDFKAPALPQSGTEKEMQTSFVKPQDNHDFQQSALIFDKPNEIKSNSCAENPNNLKNSFETNHLHNKTKEIETSREVINSEAGITTETKQTENDTITRSSDKIQSFTKPITLKVDGSTLKNYQNENDFQIVSPALPDPFNTSPILPSISTTSPTPSNFSGIFSKKTSHLSPSQEEDFHKLKKKSLHSSTRPREFILPAASVLCNVDNLENATKLNKKLHWELLDNKNELTEIEDDTDVDTTDEEQQKLAGEIKQEQESPEQSPKDEQNEQSHRDGNENSQQVNYKISNMLTKVRKSKHSKYKLSKGLTSKLKNMKLSKRDSLTGSSIIEQMPFSIVLPKRQRGRPRKLENLIKATMGGIMTGPRIWKKRGRKPKRLIEFTESNDNNALLPITEIITPEEKTNDALIDESKCALNSRQNETLLLESSMELDHNGCSLFQQQEMHLINNKINQEKNLETSSIREPDSFIRDHPNLNEAEIHDVTTNVNKGKYTIFMIIYFFGHYTPSARITNWLPIIHGVCVTYEYWGLQF